jgi:uncharacterized coiled-coil protein SlyX
MKKTKEDYLIDERLTRVENKVAKIEQFIESIEIILKETSR